jgi:hypothetical protein
MRKLRLVSIAAVVALACSAGPALAADKETLVVGFENIGFQEPTTACPGGTVTLDVVSSSGAPLGTATSCILAFTGCEPFRVGCHQKVDSIITFALSGRDPLVFASKLHEVVLDDDPFTIAQLARGSIADGKGHLRGAGTAVFTADGVESTFVYVLRLGG